jgi:hypothetical protein
MIQNKISIANFLTKYLGVFYTAVKIAKKYHLTPATIQQMLAINQIRSIILQ